MKAKEKAEAKTRKAQEVKRAKEKAKQAADKLKAKLAATKAKAKAAKAKAKQAAACKAPAKKKRADDAQGGDAQPPRRLFEGGLYSHGEEFLGRLRRQLDRAAQAAEFDEADEAGGGVGGEVIETDEAVWHDEWRQRLGCWWLALPMQTRSQLGSCFGALSLHLSARFDALLGRRLPPSLRSTPPRGGGARPHPCANGSSGGSNRSPILPPSNCPSFPRSRDSTFRCRPSRGCSPRWRYVLSPHKSPRCHTSAHPIQNTSPDSFSFYLDEQNLQNLQRISSSRGSPRAPPPSASVHRLAVGAAAGSAAFLVLAARVWGRRSARAGARRRGGGVKRVRLGVRAP